MVRKTVSKLAFSDTHVDFKFLKLIFRLGKFFGTAPIAMEPTFEVSTLAKLLGLFVLAAIVCYNYFAIQIQIVVFQTYHTTITAMSWLILLTDVLLLFYCVVFLTFFRENVWRSLFRKMLKLESTVNRYEYFHADEGYVMFVKLGLIYSTFVGINIARFYTTSIKITRVNSTVSQLYSTIIFTYYISLNNWMKNRYDFLNQYLSNSMNKHQKSIEAIEKVMNAYKLADSVVEKFNKLCGGIVSYCISVSVLHLLYYFSFAIDDRTSGKIQNFLEPIVLIVSLTIMIMSCDSTEKSGLQVIKTCYHLHDLVDHPTVKEHLLLLAEYARQWRPVFSAAGFYDIHQATLSSIFSAFITYSVIIIQFNMVLVDEKTNSTDAADVGDSLERTTGS